VIKDTAVDGDEGVAASCGSGDPVQDVRTSRIRTGVRSALIGRWYVAVGPEVLRDAERRRLGWTVCNARLRRLLRVREPRLAGPCRTRVRPSQVVDRVVLDFTRSR
jgi:hypothetical protein